MTATPSPSTSSSTPPAAAPASAPAASRVAPKAPSVAPPPAPKIPRTGTLRDRGAVRRDSVHALRWSTQGAVKVLAEVDVGSATLAGTTTVGGSVVADSLRSEGPLEVGGPVDVSGTLVSDGSLHTRGTVHAREAEFRGIADLGGELTVDQAVTVKGALIAPSVRAGSLVGEGTLEVAGEVEASHVAFRFRERGRVGSFRATDLRLTVRPPSPVEMVLGHDRAVVVVRVEAESVELEGVDVRFVRAPKIVLGRNAHVTEYEGKIVRRHASARVGPESRSPPPHGLTR
jgi:cytoskeletal protein CcmA (bactofilin family)